MIAEPESLGRSLVRHQRLRLYVRISEFSPLLDDHGVFQSMRDMRHIYLRLFDVRKGPGRWEGRVRRGDDICLDANQPKHLLYRSPFPMYFALPKVS